MAILNNSNAISSGGYDINNSLRFRSSASAYLNRTPASASNRKTWTWSAWVKRGALGSTQRIFTSDNSGVNQAALAFSSTDKLSFLSYISAVQIELVTTQVFRDPSAWYHIVIALDTTQATAANRTKMYINGNQVTAFSTATYSAQNYDGVVNGNFPYYLGTYFNGTVGEFLDGYLTDVNFIDGQALTPSSFGSTDATTGSWVAKKYTGTYGTNGFYLNFSSIALTSGSNTGLGKDNSGNGNYWNTNNISVTAGTTYDAMIDSPTLTSATVGNYCVLNPLDKNSAVTVSNANLTSTAGTLNVGGKSTMMLSTGKWYYEVNVVSTTSNQSMIGFATASWALDYLGSNSQGFGWPVDGLGAYGELGTVVSGALVSYTTGDVVALAVDMDAKQLTAYKNGTAIYVWNFTGTDWFPAYSHQSTTTFAFNFGQRPFQYSAPSGFLPLNTYNLPTPTILQGNKYMDATTYTGTGATQSITNAAGFKPDLVWLKSRSVARDHRLMDTVRGINLGLQSNITNAEFTGTALSSINSNGFTLNTTDNQNVSAETYVGWQWQAGQGSTSSNTQGSITSTVSVNTTAGFSVFTFTGTGASSASIGHGLGVAPKFMIFKQRNGVSSWNVLTNAAGSNQYGFLDLTTAFAAAGETWTSTVINIGANFTNGSTYVCYAWAEIAGFSKFGSYTGNGSTDGVFVYLGFRPKFILTKRTDSTSSSNWEIHDSSRNTYNVANLALFPNTSDTEASQDDMDFLSNGFKLRYASANTQTNTNGGTYIYAAFAENPFKNANAR